MKNSQGERWRRLDNTAKLFPVVANEHLSNVFRISATLNDRIIPDFLQQALEEVLPRFEGFRARLHKGFFWYYFELNKRTPVIEKEGTYPCKYIDPHGNQMFLFRVSYYECRINLEVFHALTDGLGAVIFLKALVCRYLELTRGGGGQAKRLAEPAGSSMNVEDSYLKNYKKAAGRKYSSEKAYHLTGRQLPLDAENVLHGYVGLKELKSECRAYGVSITKYLAAALIWSVYQEYLHGEPCGERIGISLPINLRAFFDSETTANFFAVTVLEFLAQNEKHTFEEVLALVGTQMDEKITREKLEETISYNVSNEKKWYLRIAPLFIKWAALNVVFLRNDRAYTMTLSNIGPIEVEPEFKRDIKQFHMMIGVSKRQPLKCAVCAYKDQVVITFTSVFDDRRLQDAFFGFLKNRRIPVELESNGTPDAMYDKGMYPRIQYDPDKWKHMVNVFYLVLFAVAAVLGVVNYATYNGSLWSVIAIGGMIYVALTVRYSIMRHANLAFKMVVQTLAADLLLVVIDYETGYRGWAVNYAIPSTLLFMDIGVVFLIIVNRLNWQSYFMYQIAITIFSFIPVILWAAGLVTNPAMALVTVIITVLTLIITILLGDRSVKNELKRRFHL